MRRIRILPCCALLLAPTAFADLVVDAAWVRGLPPGVANTSAYMKLANTGTEAMVLTGATSPIAGSVMLHTTLNHDGMLHMTHVESVTIPAGGELLLESGGTHLMLMALRETPVPGQTVAITLQFADGYTHTLQAPVTSVLDE
jgi:hypothetical protein